MKKIWVVCGGSGQYEDRHDWVIAWYEKKADALAHAKLAGARESENKLWCLDHPDAHWGEDSYKKNTTNKWDNVPRYDDTLYYCYFIERGNDAAMRGSK